MQTEEESSLGAAPEHSQSATTDERMCRVGLLAPVTKVELELSSRPLTLAPTVSPERGEPRQLPGDQAQSELHCLGSGYGTTGESERLAVKSERWTMWVEVLGCSGDFLFSGLFHS